MYSTKEIDINILNEMPIDHVLSLYRQGYRINDGNLPKVTIQELATCPTTSKTVGQVLNLSATPTGGTPPYTVDIRKDGAVIRQFVGVTSGATVTHPYTLTATDVGTRTFGAIAYDSCAGSPQASLEDSCPVSVVSAQQFHNECIGGVCTQVSGPGTDQCTPIGASCGVTQYHNECIGGVCTQVTGPGTNACATIGASCAPPPSPFQCSPACTATQYCVLGTCVEKTYITYGAVGFGALLLFTVLK